jgi:small subunit ribosomal protein S6
MTRVYETIYVTRPDASQEMLDDLSAKLKGFVTSKGGVIGHEESWGIRELQYKIKKSTIGKYNYLAYSADPSSIKDLEFQLKITEPVLTYMTVRMNDKVTLETMKKPNSKELELGRE